MSVVEYGPFAEVFERGELDVPGYLPLLHCDGDDVQIVLRRIGNALSADPELKFVNRLFAAENWRPNLVGCLVALVSKVADPFPDLIWATFDRGSWVSPQLAATAFMKDPNFLIHAKMRLFARCPTTFVVRHWTPELHSSMGPGSGVGRSAKGVASLIELCSRHDTDTDWLKAYQQEPDVLHLVKQDPDRSDRLVADWSSSVARQLARYNGTQ